MLKNWKISHKILDFHLLLKYGNAYAYVSARPELFGTLSGYGLAKVPTRSYYLSVLRAVGCHGFLLLVMVVETVDMNSCQPKVG